MIEWILAAIVFVLTIALPPSFAQSAGTCIDWPSSRFPQPETERCRYTNPMRFCVGDRVLIRATIPREGLPLLQDGEVTSLNQDNASVRVGYGIRIPVFGWYYRHVDISLRTSGEQLYRFRSVTRGQSANSLVPFAPDMTALYSGDTVDFGASSFNGRNSAINFQTSWGRVQMFSRRSQAGSMRGQIVGFFEGLYTPLVGGPLSGSECTRSLPIYLVRRTDVRREPALYYTFQVQSTSSEVQRDATVFYQSYGPDATVSPGVQETLENRTSEPEALVDSGVGVDAAMNDAVSARDDSNVSPNRQSVVSDAGVSVETGAESATPPRRAPNRTQTIDALSVVVPMPAAYAQAQLTETNVSTWLTQQLGRGQGFTDLDWQYNESFPSEIANRTLIRELRYLPDSLQSLIDCRRLCMSNIRCNAFQIYPTPNSGRPRWSCAAHALTATDIRASVRYVRPNTIPSRFAQMLFRVTSRIPSTEAEVVAGAQMQGRLTLTQLVNWLGSAERINSGLDGAQWYDNVSFSELTVSTTLIQSVSYPRATLETFINCKNLCVGNQECAAFQYYPIPNANNYYGCSLHRLTQTEFASRVRYARPNGVESEALQILVALPGRIMRGH